MFKDLDKKDRRKIITILVVIGAILVGIFIGLLLLTFMNNNDEAPSDLGIEEKPDSLAYFENLYLIQYSVAKNANGKIFSDLQETITRPKEIATATKENEVEPSESGKTIYISKILEDSFNRLSLKSGYAYSFDISITDGRLYKCYLLPDAEGRGSSYYGLVVYNATSSAEKADFYITFVPSGTEEKLQPYDADKVVKDLTEQMKTISPYPLKDAIIKNK